MSTTTTTTTTTAAHKRQRQIVFDANNRDAERFERMIANHVGEIVKQMYVTANVKVIRIDCEDDAGLLDDLIRSLDITIHCHENIYL
jgi:hypothetical protein